MKRNLCMILAAVLVLTLGGCAWKVKLPAKAALSPGGTAGDASFGSGEITEKIERIELEWSSGRVELAQHGGSTVKIEERSSAELKQDERVHWRVDGTTLRIWFREPNGFDLLNFAKKELTLTLPETLRLDAMEISVASAEVRGSVNAEKLTVDSASGAVELTTDASELEADTASGEVRIHHSGTLEKAAFDTSSGAVTAELGDVRYLKADTASGDLTFRLTIAERVEIGSASGKVCAVCDTAPDRLEVDTASGDVELTLPKDADFRLELDTASGKFVSEIPLSIQGEHYVAGSGKADFEIGTASGDITIRSAG